MSRAQGPVVIGEFEPPHDAVTLANHAYVDHHGVGPDHRADVGQLGGRGVARFAMDVARLLRRGDALHYLTRGYDRRSLFHLLLAVVVAQLLRRPVSIVLHAELFSFFGPLRSRHVGRPLLRYCFGRGDVVCGDARSREALLAAGVPARNVRLERVKIPATAERPPSKPGDPFDRPVVVIVEEACQGLIADAVRVAAYLGDHRSVGVVALAWGPILHPGDEAIKIVREPTVAETAAWFARAALVIRPLRCDGVLQLPDELLLAELPERSPDGLDLGRGVVIVRRSIEPAPPLDELVPARLCGRASVLLVGVFDGPEPEPRRNTRLAAALTAVGTEGQRITLPTDGFDGEQASSFIGFVGRLWRAARRTDATVCLTQGLTRPSLLLVLAAAVVTRFLRQPFFVVFHDDLFAVMTRFRSRNAGLPLLWTTFSLAAAVFASPAGCRVARTYRDRPDLFVATELGEAGADASPAHVMLRLAGGGGQEPTTSRPLTCDGHPVAVGSACVVAVGPTEQVVIGKGDTDASEALAAC